ncbi:MAG: amidohydrolase [Armatimonadetes bacterium]|nr:amidohydrolase [Armatimonadota bacterium]
MIIDAHAHLGPSFATRPAFLPAVKPEEVIAILDRSGIDRACVFAAAWEGPEFTDPYYERGNEAVAEAVRRYPDRLIGYCRVDPNWTRQAVREMERGRRDFGFRGLKLHPLWEHFWSSNLKILRPVFELCREYRWPVFFHAGYYPTCQPALFVGLAKAFLDVPIILAHLAYAHTADAIVVAKRHPNIYLETSANSSSPAIAETLKRVGPDQVLYGSDLPFTEPRDVMAKIKAAPGITAEALRKIMGGNMARLLGEAQ